MVWASGLVTTALPASRAGSAVDERQVERVVPGRDDADDALGHLVDLDPGEPGTTPQPALGVEVLVGGARVVAGGQRDVQRLVERVLAGLAGLPARSGR